MMFLFFLIFFNSPNPVNKDSDTAAKKGGKLKRPLIELSVGDSNLSKKKLKKKLRNPGKLFDAALKIKYERCSLCANPKVQIYFLCLCCTYLSQTICLIKFVLTESTSISDKEKNNQQL